MCETEGDKRPIMKEVKEELEGRTDYKHYDSWGGIGHNLLNVDERETLLIEPSNYYGSSQPIAFDSMMNDMILPQMDGANSIFSAYCMATFGSKTRVSSNFSSSSSFALIGTRILALIEVRKQ
ncbi:hypothetical protein RJ639_014829 [Escallonia herrerae]|uniref:Uncharacterized protein n=1 Tax=Escallonia herrerae TaxID=1293975 RepID=A0AA88VIV3_9ASTE|nr:hypothetical protein RJ639_014829 [Escallonia herrerae]